MAIIEQIEKDCILTLYGIPKVLKDCNLLKLANTIWDKPGDKYTVEEMEGYGFVLT